MIKLSNALAKNKSLLIGKENRKIAVQEIIFKFK